MKRSLLAWLHWLSLGPDHLSITLDENRRQVFFLRSHMAYRWVREEAVSGNMGNTGFSHSKFPWCHIELPRTCQIQLSKEERSQQPCLWRKKKRQLATMPLILCAHAHLQGQKSLLAQFRAQFCWRPEQGQRLSMKTQRLQKDPHCPRVHSIP